MKKIEDIENYNELALFLKTNKITKKKLKVTVFGGTAYKVIKAMKDNPNKFKDIAAQHQIWWQTKHCINNLINT